MTEPVARPGGRAARVVADVLRATIEELGLRGYGTLSVEEVASRAGVNKTTVYRRWPTKAELVRAALVSIAEEHVRPTDTGSLRDDLLAFLRSIARLASSPRGRSIARALLAEREQPEVAALARSLRDVRENQVIVLVKRGVARGELPRDVDAHFVVEMLLYPVNHRILMRNLAVDGRWLRKLVDLVLRGAGATPKKPPSKRTKG